MLGRSKLLTNSRAFEPQAADDLLPRQPASAVAVSAMRGTAG
jgi:hypothetical protein